MRNVKRILVVLFLFSLLITLISCGGGEKLDIKLKLKTGEVYEQETVLDQKITQVVMGNSMEMDQKITMKYNQVVEEVDADGNILFNVKYAAVKFIQKTAAFTVEYDSDNPPKEIPPMAIGYDALVGLEFKMKMNNKGEVLEVFGIEEMFKKMRDKFKKSLPDLSEEEFEKMMEIIEKSYGPESMVNNMKSMSGFYPDKPISVGYKWKVENKSGPPLPLKLNTDYHFKEKKDGILLITAQSTLESDPEAEPMEIGEMKMSYNVKGTQNGTIKLDQDTGLLIESKLLQKFEGTIKMTGAQAMEWPITAESTIIVRTKKVK
ncbi:hypothetical protein KAU33_00720 [Candidatus Dependentiae bacterium]|nr:hypothetical protein [Candidatus Dependentiae bacterium]